MRHDEINERLNRHPLIQKGLTLVECTFMITKGLVLFSCIALLWKIGGATYQGNATLSRIEHYLQAHDPGYSALVTKKSNQAKENTK